MVARWKYVLGSIFSLAGLLGIATTALANSNHNERERGFEVRLVPANGFAQQSGRTTIINGEVWYKGEKDKNHHGGKTLSKLLQDKKVKFRAFFPDMTTEVTEQVVIDENAHDFRYTTPAFSAQGLNTFIVILSDLSPRSKRLLNAQAKIERRIVEFERHLSQLIAQNAKPKKIELLSSQIAKLRVIASRITAKLALEPETLAETRLPLMVDNHTAGQGYATSVQGKYRFTVVSTPGAATTGESAQLTASVTNMRNAPDSDEDENDSQWIVEYRWQGMHVHDSGPVAIDGGQTVSYTYTAEGLAPGNWDANKFHILLYHFDVNRNRYGGRFGKLGLQVGVAADTIAPQWSVTSPALVEHSYFKTMPLVDATVSDAFGRINPNTLEAKLAGTLLNGQNVDLNALSHLTVQTMGSGQSVKLSGNLNPLLEGDYSFSLRASDYAGLSALPNPYQVSFSIDTTAPSLALGISDHILTSGNSLTLPITVTDRSPTVVRVSRNGTEVYADDAPVANVNVPLNEGINLIEVSAVDAAGNTATTVQLLDVVRDSTAPLLSNLSPLDGARINALSFIASGVSNEPLAVISVNGQALTLAADKKSFSGNVFLTSEGNSQLVWQATDPAGNTTTVTNAIEAILRVLNAGLVTIEPTANGQELMIKGAIGAARAGAAIEARASLFNRASTVAAADGSFSVTLNLFSNVTITATDSSIGRSDSADFSYGINTSLSGIVKDTNDQPLANVTVSISGSNLFSVTDGSGVFTFTEPVTGDQILVVDGTTVPLLPPPAPQRKFAKTSIALSIGLAQANVLTRPIYLTPIPLDGSATELNAAQGAVVTSPHAPGVEIDIPAGVIEFPADEASGLISIATIPASRSTVAPPDFAEPLEVVSLEPSGVKFKEPVNITLPNVNELPPGVNVVIMSMNSTEGRWEIDGIGEVSSDGNSIVTEDGNGITHFSTIYATPVGPKVSTATKQDRPGANTFDGSLSSSITLPSYKALGKSIAPSLIYKSSWANPQVLVSNIFDIPTGRISFGTEDRINGSEFYLADQTEAWYEPARITSQFQTQNILGEKIEFTGAPAKAVVSYSMRLQDPDSGDYLASGVYPYTSHWEVHLKRIVVRTRKITDTRWAQNLIIAKASFRKIIEQFFPSDLNDFIYVQNERESAAGSGWKIAGAQKIANPGKERLMIEEADGSIAGYAINNTITTAFNGSSHNAEFSDGAVNFLNYPDIYLNLTSRRVGRIDLSSNNPIPQVLATLPNLTADMRSYDAEAYNGNWNLHQCRYHYYSFSMGRMPSSLIMHPDGRLFALDRSTSELYHLTNGQFNYFSGPLRNPTTWIGTHSHNIGEYNYYAQNCPTCKDANAAGFTTKGWSSIDAALNDCGEVGAQCSYLGRNDESGFPRCQALQPRGHVSTGQYPNFAFGGDGGLASSANFNRPQGMTVGTGNSIVIADTGNNRVRRIDLSTNVVTTLAGNGQTFDTGDGGLAVDASLYHPRGVAYDTVGNLYIATENGFIRKVDPTGRISTFAGKTLADGGTIGDNLDAADVFLNKPYGLVVDNDNGFLYVAEEGAHLVRRINLNTREVATVAGTGAAGFSGDSGPAITSQLNRPTHLGLDENGNLLIADAGNNRIRKVVFQNAATGVLAFAPIAKDHSKLTRQADGTWLREYRSGVKVYFDVNGRQTAAVDRVGRTTTMTYDGIGNLTSITDPTGRAVNYNYSGGKLSSIVDPAGRATSFHYSGSYLTHVTYPDGAQKQFGYNAQGLLATETNERGHPTSYVYNEWSRLQQVVRADNSAVTVNDSGSGTAGNNYVGGTATGQLKAYNENSNYDGIKDARDVETKFVKDSNGYVTTIVDGAGRTTQVTRDEKGKPLKITRPDGSEVTFVYDPATDDLLAQTDSALGVTTSQTFDAFGNLLTQTNGRGFTSQNTYNPNNGLLVSKTDPLGHGASYTYNNLGMPLSVTNALNKSTVYTYDAFGNVATVRDQLGHTTTYTRDAAGNVISVRNAKGQVTLYEYDLWNRLVAVTTPKNERTEYSYLASGELAQIKDPLNNITTFEYDNLGRLTKKTDPLGYAITRSYDQNGNVVGEIDPNGNNKTFEYDALNQLVRKNLPDNSLELSYDVRGNLTVAKNNQSQVAFGYDVGSRLTSVNSRGLGALSGLPNITIGYSYDANGNRITMTDPVGTTSYFYDNADRMYSLTNPKGESFGFTFDNANRLTQMSRPGSSTALSFDDRNFVTSIVHSRGGNTVSSFNYAMDSIGNRTQITTQVGSFNFGYDDNNQLTSATNPETPAAANGFNSESFNYDAIYNRTSDQGGNYVYDGSSVRLTEDYKNIYAYDNNGNLISKQKKGLNGEVTNFEYSSENQLLRFKLFDPNYSSTMPAKEVEYTYDALGRRIQKQVVDHRDATNVTKTFTRRFVYDGQEIALEYDGSNSLLARYTHSTLRTDDVLAVDVRQAGVNAALAQNAQTYTYLKDAQGTITDIAGNAGNKLQHYIYSAFGTILGIQNSNAADITANPVLRTSYSYTGREFDSESGNFYYRARYYDSAVGRMLQKDPHPGIPEIPGSVNNSYAYGLNNPIIQTDPSGRILPFIAAVAIGAIIGGLVNTAIHGFDWSQFGTGAAIGAVLTVAAISGGAAGGLVGGALGGGFAGAAGGAVAGAVVGGLIGGIGYELTGVGSFGQGFIAGAISGGIAGGFQGYAGSSKTILARDYSPCSSRNNYSTYSVEYTDYSSGTGQDVYPLKHSSFSSNQAKANLSHGDFVSWALNPSLDYITCAIAQNLESPNRNFNEQLMKHDRELLFASNY